MRILLTSKVFKYSYILTLLAFSQLAFSQGEANKWYFGYNAALDFNSGTPIAITNSNMYTDEGSASISDETGNLLFFTDGTTV